MASPAPAPAPGIRSTDRDIGIGFKLQLRSELEDGRKSTDMDQGKNPVEEGWKFLQNAKELTSHQTLTSTHKGTNNRTPTRKLRVYPPTILDFVLRLQT